MTVKLFSFFSFSTLNIRFVMCGTSLVLSGWTAVSQSFAVDYCGNGLGSTLTYGGSFATGYLYEPAIAGLSREPP